MSPPPKIVVTLVHGTRAPNAPWTQPGSKMYTQVLDKIPGWEATINTFPWVGKNSAVARQRKAEALASQLKQQFDDDPLAQHFVIGHSHGGNLAVRGSRSQTSLITLRSFAFRRLSSLSHPVMSAVKVSLYLSVSAFVSVVCGFICTQLGFPKGRSLFLRACPCGSSSPLWLRVCDGLETRWRLISPC